MNYYILQQDPRIQPQPSILRIPDDIDPEQWLEGKSIKPPAEPLRLQMSERSGKFRGNIIGGLKPKSVLEPYALGGYRLKFNMAGAWMLPTERYDGW